MILDHGVIGNGSLIAMIHPNTSMDWLCLPRFDSPSIFGRILDENKGGHWRFLSGGQELKGEMKYVRNTNVLVTRFKDGDTEWELFDFAPRIPAGLTQKAPLRVIRYLRPIKGKPRLTVDFNPRPDYGRVEPTMIPIDHGIMVDGGPVPLTLHSNVPAPYIGAGREFVLDRPRYFVLSCDRGVDPIHLDEVNRDLDLTIAGWRQWVQGSYLPSFADTEVIRSALCLKLHAYNETGATIAAATTSIPEAIGEPRTWDYRFCWLRDSAFTVEALRRLAHFQEGRHFMQFILDVAEGGPLQPLYGIGGERLLTEYELDHLDGFEGTKPVRIGNQASEQLQTDLMGEVVLCLRTLLTDARVELPDPMAWMPLVERMVQESVDAFDVADLGIWEYRDGAKLHTFSRAMCWAAAHHGAAIAAHFGREEQAADWNAHADKMRERILNEGYSEELGMFTQAFGDTFADAANLLLPAIGLIDARDPRFISTLDAYRKILVHNDGVMRYVHDDDFGSPKSTFTICSFWWIEALALAGFLDEAIETFHRVASFANPLGLFSEDVDLETGRLLGNFPQAYTHVGLINAATTIGTLLRARENRLHAWT